MLLPILQWKNILLIKQEHLFSPQHQLLKKYLLRFLCQILAMAPRAACLSSALLPAVLLESCLNVTESSSTPSPPLWMPAWCTAAPAAWPWFWETSPLLWAQWPSTPSTQTRSWPTCPSCHACRLTWTPAALETPPPQGTDRTDPSARRTPRPAFKLVSDQVGVCSLQASVELLFMINISQVIPERMSIWEWSRCTRSSWESTTGWSKSCTCSTLAGAPTPSIRRPARSWEPFIRYH